MYRNPPQRLAINENLDSATQWRMVWLAGGKLSLPRWKVKTMISDKASANDSCQDENVWVILAALNCFLVRKLMENVGQCHSGTAWEFFEYFEMYD